MSKENEIVIKEKNPIIKTLQWIGVSAVSILLIVYFLVIDTSGGQRTPTIGSVNGTPIYYTSTSPYGRAFKGVESQYQKIGIPINDEMYQYIEDLAFRTAVSSILLNNIAKKNINVSDNFIVEALRSQFVDTNGIYNQAAYDAFIKNSTQSEKLRIEKDLRDDILSQTAASELFTSIKYNSLEIEREFKKNLTKKDIEMVYINAYSLVQNSEIPSSDLDKYFKDNKTNFAQADISWIILESGGVADNLYKSLKDDISLFDKNALEKSIDTNNYKLGYITKMEMPSESFAEKVFADNKGKSLLKPIYANGVYYIVLVNGIRIPEKYTDVNQDVLRREYLNANMPSLLDAEKTKQAEILKAAVVGTDDFKTLDGNGAIVYYKPSQPFSYNQGKLNTAEGAIIPDSDQESFYTHTFSLAVGASTDVIKLDNGVAVIKLVSDEKPDMNRLTSLNSSAINNIRRELSKERVNDIQLEWETRNMESARIKRNNLR